MTDSNTDSTIQLELSEKQQNSPGISDWKALKQIH
jgi:hypothetical protein